VGEKRRPIINYSGGTEIGGGILSCFVGLPQKPVVSPVRFLGWWLTWSM